MVVHSWGMSIDVADLELPGLAQLPGYVEGRVPAWALSRLVEELDPDTLLTDGQALDFVAASRRLASWATSRELAGTAEFVRRPEYVGPDPVVPLARRAPAGQVARGFAGLEIAARLGMAARTADRQVALATRLATDLAPTGQALAEGRIDLSKAQLIASETVSAAPHVTALVQDRVLARAGERTPTQLTRQLRRALLAADPYAAGDRCARSRADRWVRIWADGDDMAMLQARLPVETAAALDSALARAAGDRQPGDERTVDQRHADALVDLLLGDGSGITAQVQVTVPASVLAGLSEAPAEIVGLGPISAHLARLIAADATWRRLLTDPATNMVIDVAATPYRPGAVLQRLVAARDQSCVSPSCSRPAHACDTDHTVEWPNGPTAPANLGSLCRRQHRFKQHPAVTLEQPTPGQFVWTYPTGHRYHVAPTHPTNPTHSPTDRGASARGVAGRQDAHRRASLALGYRECQTVSRDVPAPPGARPCRRTSTAAPSAVSRWRPSRPSPTTR